VFDLKNLKELPSPIEIEKLETLSTESTGQPPLIESANPDDEKGKKT
jgi:hypothetical protein